MPTDPDDAPDPALHAAAVLLPVRRAFPDDWPLEEMRVKRSVADLYRRAYGVPAAQWAMARMGFPTPPARLIRFGAQPDLFMDG